MRLRSSLRRALTSRRVLGAGATAALIGSGVAYYRLRYVPLARLRSRPLPPRRTTPVFASGNEGFTGDGVPEGMSTVYFYCLAVYRTILLLWRAAPVLWFLLLTSIHGSRVNITVEGAEKDRCERLVGVDVAQNPKGTSAEVSLTWIESKDDKTSGSGSTSTDKSSTSAASPTSPTKVLLAEKKQVSYTWQLCPREVAFEKLLQLLKDMGPTYVKLGQWMATRGDIFPEDLIAKLSNLFDSVPPHSWQYTESELKKSGLLEQLTDVSKESLSSGSIAQIHTASLKFDVVVAPEPIGPDEPDPTPRGVPLSEMTLPIRIIERTLAIFGCAPSQIQPQPDRTVLPAGTRVAVKLEHPGTRTTILADIAVMRFGAMLIDRILGFDFLALNDSVAEFSAFLLSQLDLRRECDNLLRFRYNFYGDPAVTFPLPIPSLTSATTLVETFEEGVPCQSVRPTRELADVGCRMFLKMLFDHNFVHADLHPGNLLVRYRHEDGSVTREPRSPSEQGLTACAVAPNSWRGVCDRMRHWWEYFSDFSLVEKPQRARREHVEVVVLDAGLVTSLSPKDRYNFISLFTAVACGNGDLGAKLMLERSPDQRCDDPEAFSADMKQIFDKVGPNSLHGFALGEVEMGKTLRDIFSVLRRHRVRVDGNFTTLVATVIVGEGLGRRMQPDYNIFGESVPYLVTCLDHHEMAHLLGCLTAAYSPSALRRRDG